MAVTSPSTCPTVLFVCSVLWSAVAVVFRSGRCRIARACAKGRPYVTMSGTTVVRETYRACELSGWRRTFCTVLSPFVSFCDEGSFGSCREVIEVVPAPPLPPCDTLECTVTRAVESTVSFADYAGRNPITVWWRVAQWAVTEVSTKVPVLLRIFSVLLLLVVLNAGAIALSRFANLLV